MRGGETVSRRSHKPEIASASLAPATNVFNSRREYGNASQRHTES